MQYAVALVMLATLSGLSSCYARLDKQQWILLVLSVFASMQAAGFAYAKTRDCNDGEKVTIHGTIMERTKDSKKIDLLLESEVTPCKVDDVEVFAKASETCVAGSRVSATGRVVYDVFSTSLRADIVKCIPPLPPVDDPTRDCREEEKVTVSGQILGWMAPDQFEDRRGIFNINPQSASTKPCQVLDVITPKVVSDRCKEGAKFTAKGKLLKGFNTRLIADSLSCE